MPYTVIVIDQRNKSQISNILDLYNHNIAVAGNLPEIKDSKYLEDGSTKGSLPFYIKVDKQLSDEQQVALSVGLAKEHEFLHGIELNPFKFKWLEFGFTEHKFFSGAFTAATFWGIAGLLSKSSRSIGALVAIGSLLLKGLWHNKNSGIESPVEDLITNRNQTFDQVETLESEAQDGQDFTQLKNARSYAFYADTVLQNRIIKYQMQYSNDINDQQNKINEAQNSNFVPNNVDFNRW